MGAAAENATKHGGDDDDNENGDADLDPAAQAALFGGGLGGDVSGGFCIVGVAGAVGMAAGKGLLAVVDGLVVRLHGAGSERAESKGEWEEREEGWEAGVVCGT